MEIDQVKRPIEDKARSDDVHAIWHEMLPANKVSVY